MPSVILEISDRGYLRIPQAVAAQYFPQDVLVPLWRDSQLWLLPTRGHAAGGLILKQRNAAGDRSVLLSETFDFAVPCGKFEAEWVPDFGALRLSPQDTPEHPIQ